MSSPAVERFSSDMSFETSYKRWSERSDIDLRQGLEEII